MSKKYLIGLIVLLILILAGGGYYWWMVKNAKSPAEQAAEDIQKAAASAAQDAATAGLVPVTDTSATANAVSSAPDVNPYSGTNPFENIKINPFQ